MLSIWKGVPITHYSFTDKRDTKPKMPIKKLDTAIAHVKDLSDLCGITLFNY